jgi:spore germination cell wall hydrolase CwlJ-like protein
MPMITAPMDVPRKTETTRLHRDFAREVAVRTIYGEARGESEEGQRAVAHVLWNRVRDGRWGQTLATVCLARMQFSCWNASDPNRQQIAEIADNDPILERLHSLLDAARTEKDPTYGATHYFSTSMIQPPSWSIGATLCGTFGRHRFYRDVE